MYPAALLIMLVHRTLILLLLLLHRVLNVDG